MRNHKKIFIGIVIVAAVALFVGMFAGMGSLFDFGKKNNEMVIAKVKKAQIGCSVMVTFTDKGKKKYNKAATYRISDKNDKLASPISYVNGPTTVFPAKSSGDPVKIAFYTRQNKKIGVEYVYLQSQ